MKKVIRIGVFETNSSSTHSVCIANGPCEDTIVAQLDGKVHIEVGEFGWEVQDYWDAASKASYALTWCHNRNKYKSDVCARPKHLQMLKEVIEEYTGCDVIFDYFDDEFYKYGYIDHQSDERDYSALAEAMESKESLKQFIFNKNSLLHTDNDNR